MTQDQDMTREQDARIGALLRQAAPAPAARDAMFRIQVLERRERRRFQRRRALIATAAVVAGAIALTGLFAGDEIRMAASIGLVAVAAGMAGMTALLTRRIGFARI